MTRIKKIAPTGITINAGGQIEDDEELQSMPLENESADDHDFDSFVAELSIDQGRLYESKVYRASQGHTRENELLFVFRPGEITLTGLQMKVRSDYGPGRYFVRTYVSGIDPVSNRPYTQLMKGGTFKFAIGATLGGQSASTAFNPLALMGGDKNSLALLEKFMGQQSKPRGMDDPMMAMMMETSRQQNQLLMVLLTGMLGRGATGPDPIDQLTKLAALQKTLGFAGGPAEEPDTLDRILDSVDRVLPSVFNAVGSAYGNRAAPAPSGAPSMLPNRTAAPQLDPKLLATLQGHAELIGKLPAALQFNVDPVAIADQVLEGVATDEDYAALLAWVTHPQLVDALVAVVPSLGGQREKLGTWIGAFSDAIANAEAEDDEEIEQPGATLEQDDDAA